RVAELDRHAARLLRVEPVRVDAGQRAHERRLAVVDVSRRADDHDREATRLPEPMLRRLRLRLVRFAETAQTGLPSMFARDGSPPASNLCDGLRLVPWRRSRCRIFRSAAASS